MENHSLFFVPAHTVTVRRSLRTILIMTTTPLCPKSKLQWSVANSKSQAIQLCLLPGGNSSSFPILITNPTLVSEVGVGRAGESNGGGGVGTTVTEQH